MQSDRDIRMGHVQRQCATPEIRREVASWTKWEAGAGEPFEIHYGRAVSFCVMEGRAEIAFADGAGFDIQEGDFVTIEPDIRGIWTVIEPITNHTGIMSVGRLRDAARPLVRGRPTPPLSSFPRVEPACPSGQALLFFRLAKKRRRIFRG